MKDPDRPNGQPEVPSEDDLPTLPLAARGETRPGSERVFDRDSALSNPRRTSGSPPVLRLDSQPNPSFSPTDDFHHGLLGNHAALPGQAAEPEIAGFRILGLLGEGAMGVVYLAQQEAPRRRVALKVLRSSFATPSMLARFEQEGELLGRLHHRGIAQIYQAGTAGTGSGHLPYFAMEYVRGRTLVDYVEQAGLNPGQRLELLARICGAVQHAHENGVVHRDLKPANILVTEEGFPKILDFGIARATDSDLAVTTRLTDVGQLIGTVRYMSPEQASGDPTRINNRSDVYSLGVIAHELLSGRLPYDLRGKSLHEAVRIIREQEPERLGRIDRTLSGDVETIVAKALEKDSEWRYHSAHDLASDIRRYLGDEPIAARAPSLAYRLGKFARRNKAVVASLAAIIVALVAATAVSLVFAVRAESARRQAVEERDLSDAARRSAIAERLLDSQPTVALAHAIGSLEVADSEEARNLALRALWREPPGSMLLPNGGEVSWVRFSDDGRSLAVAGDRGALIWDEGGRRARTLEGLREPAIRAEFTADGDTLSVLGFFTNTISRWGVEDGLVHSRLELDDPPELAVGLSPDGLHQLAARWDGHQTLATYSTIGGGGGLVRRFPFPLAPGGIALAKPGEHWPWALEATGRWLAWAFEGEVFVVELRNLETAPRRRLGTHGKAVFDLAFSDDGRWLASHDLEGGIRVWDLAADLAADPAAITAFSGPGWPGTVTLGPGGDGLAASSIDQGYVKVWDLRGPPEANPLVARLANVGGFTKAAFHPEGGWLVVGTYSGAVMLPWTSRRPRVLTSSDKVIWGVRFTPDGSRVVSHGVGHRVVVWPLAAGGAERAEVVAPGGDVGGRSMWPGGCLAVDPGGRFLLTGSENGRVRLLPLVKGGARRELWRFATGVGEVALDATGRLAAASGSTERRGAMTIRIWDVLSGAEVALLEPPEVTRIHQILFLTDGRLLSVDERGLRIWKVEEGSSRMLLASRIYRVAADATGSLLVAVIDGSVQVVDLETGSSKPLPGYFSRVDVSAVAVAGSKRLVASGDKAGVVRVGPVDGEPHLLYGHTETITSLTFNSDATQLASTGTDGTIRIWPVPQGRPLHTLPLEELLETLRSLTNVRVVADEEVPGGFNIVFEPFAGWDRQLTW